MAVCMHQWRIQDLEKEGAHPIFLVKRWGAPPFFGLNWGLKMAYKLLSAGQKEGAPASKYATVHLAGPLEMCQSFRVSIVFGCSPGELLASAAFMYHDDIGRNALKHYPALNGLLNYM